MIANLSSVFSSNTKVLAELLQNARRAGATRIDVAQTGEILTIADNGSGIADFGNLLTLAQSDWNEDVMSDEGPYGMGFFSALFAAKKVVVKSLGKQIEIDTQIDLLGQEIKIEPSVVQSGTVVELYDHNIPDVMKNLIQYCEAFSVDVFFTGNSSKNGESVWLQGELIPSPRRLDDTFEEFSLGHIRYKFDSFKNLGGNSLDYVAYLQGFKVASSSDSSYFAASPRTVIHLDSTFKARMPDRDSLINAKTEKSRIEHELKLLWIKKLYKIKANNPYDLFEYYNLIRDLNILDIFNDVEVVPEDFMVLLEDPVKTSESRNYYYRRLGKKDEGTVLLSKATLQGELIVNGDPTNYDNSDSDYVMALQMALYISNTKILDKKLDPGHWIYQLTKTLPDFEEDGAVSVSYSPIKTGKWEGFDVHIVDSYSIVIPSLGLDIKVDSTHSLAIGGDEYGSGRDELLVAPNSWAGVLDQVRTWYWDDTYHEDSEHEDKQSLNAYIELLRGKDDASVVSSLLGRSDWTIRNALAGKSFTITFLENGDVEAKVVE